MSVSAQPVRLTYDEYVIYTELHPDGDFELLDGIIYESAPEGSSHKITRLKIDKWLHAILDPARYTIGTEASFPAPGWKEGPKPDNYVAKGELRLDDPEAREPHAEDMLLVIEITNSPKIDDDKDLQRKLRTYALLSIPEYWLIDLGEGRVIVHREPSGDTERPAYKHVRTAGRDERISALQVDDLSINTSILLSMAANS